jgi:hypothetical protein
VTYGCIADPGRIDRDVVWQYRSLDPRDRLVEQQDADEDDRRDVDR